jgi:hypothetical protein
LCSESICDFQPRLWFWITITLYWKLTLMMERQGRKTVMFPWSSISRPNFARPLHIACLLTRYMLALAECDLGNFNWQVGSWDQTVALKRSLIVLKCFFFSKGHPPPPFSVLTLRRTCIIFWECTLGIAKRMPAGTWMPWEFYLLFAKCLMIFFLWIESLSSSAELPIWGFGYKFYSRSFKYFIVCGKIIFRKKRLDVKTQGAKLFVI